MGAGVPPGLQNQSLGVSSVRGGFDSHILPPMLYFTLPTSHISLLSDMYPIDSLRGTGQVCLRLCGGFFIACPLDKGVNDGKIDGQINKNVVRKYYSTERRRGYGQKAGKGPKKAAKKGPEQVIGKGHDGGKCALGQL